MAKVDFRDAPFSRSGNGTPPFVSSPTKNSVSLSKVIASLSSQKFLPLSNAPPLNPLKNDAHDDGAPLLLSSPVPVTDPVTAGCRGGWSAYYCWVLAVGDSGTGASVAQTTALKLAPPGIAARSSLAIAHFSALPSYQTPMGWAL